MSPTCRTRVSTGGVSIEEPSELEPSGPATMMNESRNYGASSADTQTTVSTVTQALQVPQPAFNHDDGANTFNMSDSTTNATTVPMSIHGTSQIAVNTATAVGVSTVTASSGQPQPAPAAVSAFHAANLQTSLPTSATIRSLKAPRGYSTIPVSTRSFNVSGMIQHQSAGTPRTFTATQVT